SGPSPSVRTLVEISLTETCESYFTSIDLPTSPVTDTLSKAAELALDEPSSSPQDARPRPRVGTSRNGRIRRVRQNTGCINTFRGSRDSADTLSGRPSHAVDEALHPLVVRPERVLAQDRPLGLVVELEVHPVDGEVASALLGLADELAAQPG